MVKRMVVEEVLKHARKRDKILIARSRAGGAKLKIKYGLFYMRTKRLWIDSIALCDVLEALKNNPSSKPIET